MTTPFSHRLCSNLNPQINIQLNINKTIKPVQFILTTVINMKD